jgi:hypothetical protein
MNLPMDKCEDIDVKYLCPKSCLAKLKKGQLRTNKEKKACGCAVAEWQCEKKWYETPCKQAHNCYATDPVVCRKEVRGRAYCTQPQGGWRVALKSIKDAGKGKGGKDDDDDDDGDKKGKKKGGKDDDDDDDDDAKRPAWMGTGECTKGYTRCVKRINWASAKSDSRRAAALQTEEMGVAFGSYNGAVSQNDLDVMNTAQAAAGTCSPDGTSIDPSVDCSIATTFSGPAAAGAPPDVGVTSDMTHIDSVDKGTDVATDGSDGSGDAAVIAGTKADSDGTAAKEGEKATDSSKDDESSSSPIAIILPILGAAMLAVGVGLFIRHKKESKVQWTDHVHVNPTIDDETREAIVVTDPDGEKPGTPGQNYEEMQKLKPAPSLGLSLGPQDQLARSGTSPTGEMASSQRSTNLLGGAESPRPGSCPTKGMEVEL